MPKSSPSSADRFHDFIIKHRPILWLGANAASYADPPIPPLQELIRILGATPSSANKDPYTQLDRLLHERADAEALRTAVPNTVEPGPLHLHLATLLRAKHLRGAVDTGFYPLVPTALQALGEPQDWSLVDAEVSSDPAALMYLFSSADAWRDATLQGRSAQLVRKRFRKFQRQLSRILRQPMLFGCGGLTDPPLLTWIQRLQRRQRRSLRPWMAFVTPDELQHLKRLTRADKRLSPLLSHPQVLVLEQPEEVLHWLEPLATGTTRIQELRRAATELAQQGRHDEAETNLHQALTLYGQVFGDHPHPQHVSLLRELSCLQVIRAQYEHAEVLCREAIAIDRSVGGQQRSTDALVCSHQLAALLLRRGQAQEALEHAQSAWSEAVEQDQGILAVQHGPTLVDTLLALGRSEAAARVGAQVAELLERLPVDHPVRIEVEEQIGLREPAPLAPPPILQKATAFLGSGQEAKALELLQGLIETAQEEASQEIEASACSLAALACMQLDRLVEAESYAKSAVYLTNALAKPEANRQARELLNAIQERQQQQAPPGGLEEAVEFLQAGRGQDALRLSQDIAEYARRTNNPAGEATACNIAALACMQLKRWSQAKECAQRALTISEQLQQQEAIEHFTQLLAELEWYL